MVSALLVGIGAFIGGVIRYGVSVALASRVTPDGFPWHTFAVNVIGCLAAGIAVGILSGKPDSSQLQLFLVTGVLGGLTTFSAFGLETVGMLKAGNIGLAAIYVFASLLGGFAGVFAGLKIS
jgi:CrcB protein